MVFNWFTDVVSREIDLSSVEEAIASGALQPVLDSLGLTPREVNDAVALLGWPFLPIDSTAEISQQFRAWRQLNRSRITDAIRTRYLDDYKAGADLSEYVQLIDLSKLDVDFKWSELFVEIDVSAVESHVNNWLTSNGCSVMSEVTSLPDLDSVRLANRAALSSVVPRAQLVVRAWRLSHGSPSASDDAHVEWNVDALAGCGLLDFEVLDEQALVEVLAKSVGWPAGMPATLDLPSLNLAATAIAAVSTGEASEKYEAEMRRQQIGFGEDVLTVVQANYAAIVQLMRERADRRLFDVLPREASLNELAVLTKPEHRRVGRAGTTVGQPRLSQLQTSGIGLVGEVLALEWLKEQYPGLTEDAWKSGYRNQVLGDGGGDDSLGYDFEVHAGKQRILYEVKATTGDDTEFVLTPAEMACAQEVRRGERYRVIFVQHALEPDAFKIHILPNPLSPQFRQNYRFAGEGLRLRFALSLTVAAD